MKCKQVQAALAIAPREWSEAERQQIEAHLLTCTACAAIARDYARQADRLAALSRTSLSMAQQQAIMAQVLRAPQYPWSRRFVNVFGAAAGVLILGLVVIALLWVVNQPTSLSLTATVTSVLTPTMMAAPTATPGTTATRPSATTAHYTNPDLGFAVDYPAGWTVENPVELYPNPDPLGRPGIQVEFRSDLQAYDDSDAFGFYAIQVAVKDSLGKTLTETVDNELSPIGPQFRSGIVRECCLLIDGQAAATLTNLPTYRWGEQQFIMLAGGREYRLTFTPQPNPLSTRADDVKARIALDTFLKTFTFISAPKPLSSHTLTPSPVPIEPTPAPPSPAPLPTVMLPDGTFATATLIPIEPLVATEDAAQQATAAASRATLIARATASPFPTAGPSSIQIEHAPFHAITQQGGLSLEVSLPKLSYVAGESGRAEVTLRNNTGETLFAESAMDLTVLDERGQMPDPWPWAPLSLPGRMRGLGTNLGPGQIVTATVSFRVPPLEQAQGHQFSVWLETLYRESLPGLPDIPGDISVRFEAGPLPLQVTAPSAEQQLKANLQLDQSGWHLQVTDQAGQLPASPLQGEIEATWSNGAMTGGLPAGTQGSWSGEWPEYRASQSGGPLIARAWVAAPGYVTAAVTQTLPADSMQSNAQLSQLFNPRDLATTRHVFASLEEAQSALKEAIYQPIQLPAGTLLDKIEMSDFVPYEDRHRVKLTQVYRLPGDAFLTVSQQSTNEDNDAALWGTARYAPDAQQVTMNNAPGYVIQRFGFWRLDWKVNDQVFELRTPVSALSLQQLVDMAVGVQPLR